MRSTLLISLALGGCSIAALDDFAIPSCAQHADCEPLNTSEGIGAQDGMRYQCEEQPGEGSVRRCVLRPRDDDSDGITATAAGGEDCDDADAAVKPGAAETCNGIDDDCDGVVDDGVPRDEREIAVEVDGGAALAWTEDRAWFAQDGDASFAPIASSRPTPGELLAMRTSTQAATTAALTVPASRELTAGCTAPDGRILASCKFRALAVAANDDIAFAGFVDTEGCAAGRLHVGHIALDAMEPAVLMPGPLRRSVTYRGIDASDDCTGAGQGATAPAIAIGENDTALLAYVGARLDDERECGSAAAAEVKLLGLYVERDPSGFAWTTATGEGVPVVLGTTTGAEPPTLLSLGERGFLVAFVSADGLEIHHVAPLAPPPPFADDSTSPIGDDRSGRTTPPLPTPRLVHSIGGARGTIAIARGRDDGDAIEIGLAVSDGCAGSPLEFDRLRIDLEAGDATVLTQQPLGSFGGSALAIVHTDGIRRARADREPTSGFVVAYVDDGEPAFVRIADVDGAIVGEPETVPIDDALSIALDVNDGVTLLSHRGGDTRTIVATPLLCDPSR